MKKSFSLVFAGDTSLGEWYLRRQGDTKLTDRLERSSFSFFQAVNGLVKDCDHFVVNLETVVEEEPSGFIAGKEYPNWDHPERILNCLNLLGVTAVCLSNNHSMDFGAKVMLSTKSRVEASGVKVFGAGVDDVSAGAPLKLQLEAESGRKNVYVFSGMNAGKRYKEEYKFFASEKKAGISELVLETMVKSIAETRKVDPEALIIVFPHWQGQDYKWASQNNWIRDVCRSAVDAGADYVLGQGPHMANDIERYQDGVIAYSIGNFVFNSPGRYQKFGVPPYSFVVRLEVIEDNGHWNVSPCFYPIVTDNRQTDYETRPATWDEVTGLVRVFSDKYPTDKGSTEYELGQDSNGAYITVKSPRACTQEGSTGESALANNDTFSLIAGTMAISDLDFDDAEVIKKQVHDLQVLNRRLDAFFKEYYDKLSKSRMVRRNELNIVRQIGETAKKEYVTHGLLRKFEREGVSIRKAVSFREIMVEKSELHRIGCSDLAWKLDKKSSAYEFADRIGLRRPASDARFYRFEEIPRQSGPAVVKPVSSTGSMGVYLIFNENSILSAREGIYLTSWEDLQKDARKKLEDGRAGKNPLLRQDKWMVEELVLSAIGSTVPPSDLKFYSFYGEVLLVLEANRSQHGKFCFWDPEMKRATTGKYEQQNQVLTDAKGFTQEDLDKAMSVSLQIPVPFIRIDMLKGHDGLVFGEATPRPGRFHLFNDEYDRKLGEAYRRAEDRILNDLLSGAKQFVAPFSGESTA